MRKNYVLHHNIIISLFVMLKRGNYHYFICFCCYGRYLLCVANCLCIMLLNCK